MPRRCLKGVGLQARRLGRMLPHVGGQGDLLPEGLGGHHLVGQAAAAGTSRLCFGVKPHRFLPSTRHPICPPHHAPAIQPWLWLTHTTSTSGLVPAARHHPGTLTDPDACLPFHQPLSRPESPRHSWHTARAEAGCLELLQVLEAHADCITSAVDDLNAWGPEAALSVAHRSQE